MTLNLRMVLQADSGAAKAALDDTARGIKGVTAATAEQTAKSRAAATAADTEAAAKRRSAQASTAMANANRMAAGSTGNLVAQLNDVGMMLAAGQNPLMLAVQQGSQIAQVIGPMGAAGAARALGAAFMGLLNPINLITIGGIAAGAAILQWLTSADAEAAAVTEELERQRAAIEGIVNETEKLRLARGMMVSGAQSEDEQIVLEEINRLTAEREAVQTRLNSLLEIGSRAAGFGAQAAAQREALTAELAALDAKINALEKQRELNAATENGRAIAEQLKTATVSVTSALQSADGSQLVAAFAAAFPTARALFGITQGIVGMLGSFDYSTLGDDERGSQRGGRRSVGEWRSREAVSTRLAGMGKGPSGGGGAAARDEADALQELIDSLEGEIDALRVQDPLQKEMLQHRKALEGATEAERRKVEELIATRERERAQLEQIDELQDFLESTVDDAFEALIVKGESLQDVLKGVIAALAKAAIQAAIFGSGPLGGMFGNMGIGAMLFGGGKAEGGMVHGPGTGTSDSIITALSNGEYVVNARATARNRHLLEAINAGGRIGGFAEGGYVGADARRMAARGDGGGSPTFNINLAGARGDREIEEAAHRGMKRALQEYDRDSLPGSVKRISRDQKRVG